MANIHSGLTLLLAGKSSWAVLLVIICGLYPIGRLHSQTQQSLGIVFEKLTAEHGLSSNKVISVAQDSSGFIWIGTQEGLHRYDGFDVITFTHDPSDATSLSNSTAEVIYVDRSGVMWIGTWGGLNKYDAINNSFTRYRYNPDDPKSLSHDHISDIQEDRAGRLWVSTGYGGVNRYDPQTDAFVRYSCDPEDKTSLSYSAASTLYLDRKGTLWIGTGSPWDLHPESGGLNRYDPSTDSFIQYLHDPNDPLSIAHNSVSALYEDREGNFWVATWGGGVQLLDRKKGTFLSPEHDASSLDLPVWTHERIPGSSTITTILEDQEGYLWIGDFQHGLKRFDPRTQASWHFHHNANDPTTLSDNLVWDIFEDRQNILWICTWNGLNKLVNQPNNFDVIGQPTARTTGLRDKHVEEILLDKRRNLWVGTWSGLERIDLVTGAHRFIGFKPPGERGNLIEMVLSLHEDTKENIWLGTRNSGLAKYDHRSNKITFYPEPDGGDASLVISCITEDHEGRLWIGHNDGVRHLDPATGIYSEPYDPESLGELKQFINVITARNNNCILIGSANGLDQYCPSNNKVISLLDGYEVMAILEEEDCLWLGLRNGSLLKFHPGSGQIKSYAQAEGIPGKTVQGLIKDDIGRLWVSTDQGIAWRDTSLDIFHPLSRNQSIPIREFYPQSVEPGPNGTLLFGGNGGILRVRPARTDIDRSPPIPVITGIKVHNLPADSLLLKSFSPTGDLLLSVRLPPRQNDLTFEFTGLHYTQPEKNRFRYVLDNYEEDWRSVGNSRTAIYPNLPPGEYTFRIQSANPDGIWGEDTATVAITITPPWWKTPTALLVFVLLSGATIMLLLREQRIRIRKKEQTKARIKEARLRAEIAENRAQQLRDLDEAKAQLYTNITHEFRTPLTVILGMVNNILGHQHERSIIERNSRNLLQLINQLLDLAKLESNAMKLTLVQGDIMFYLQYLTESFYSLAREKDIRLLFYPEVSQLIMDYDERVIQQVIYNLLSNAIKFTPKGGRVILHANRVDSGKGPALQLKVVDSGIGIAAEELPQIYDHFYQVEQSLTKKHGGTGIGLALTKKLVDLAGGIIRVDSTVGKGTTFSLQFPITNKAPFREVYASIPGAPPETIEGAQRPKLLPETPAEERPALLLIEDNQDIITYISDILSSAYQIVHVEDGVLGVEKALDLVPDVIISDVMMPRMNGYEVCEKLKNDERSSHIPIILLTAKSTQEDRIKGLQTGADAYLVKPFHKEELLIRLRQLIWLRKALQANYSPGTPYTQKILRQRQPNMEERFLQKLITVVNDRIDDPDLAVLHLCHAAELSNTQVNRKLKALTGRTPSQFIRSIRLERAVELLKTTEMHVGEVAYAVGFNDPNYFTRTFTEEFGLSPSEARK